VSPCKDADVRDEQAQRWEEFICKRKGCCCEHLCVVPAGWGDLFEEGEGRLKQERKELG